MSDRVPMFPVFVSLEGKQVLVVGGGEVAARRVGVLLDFGAVVTVVAPEISERMREVLGGWGVVSGGDVRGDSKWTQGVPGEKEIASAGDAQEVSGRVVWRQEVYAGLDGMYALVIAATNARSVNRAIGEDAKKMGILASVADRGEESTFWFPAIMRGGGLVAGMVSDGQGHGAVKVAAKKIRAYLEEMT